MLDKLMIIKSNSKPENLHIAKYEGVIINSTCSQAFLFGETNMNKIDYAKYRKHWIVWNKNNPNNLIVIGNGNVIHHIDENPNNNLPENLMKITHGEHTTFHHTGAKRSKKTGRKISEKARGNKRWLGKKHTKESRKKMSDAQSGKKHHLYGKKRPEVGQKISKALKGKYASNKHYLCGRKHSEETKKKKSIAMKKYYANKKGGKNVS